MSQVSRVASVLEQIAGSWSRMKAGGYRSLLAAPEGEAIQIGFDMASPRVLRDSARLWISPEMLQVVTHAAASLPNYPWRPDLLPWPSAVCVTSGSIYNLPHPRRSSGIDHIAMQWISDREACVVNLWSFEPSLHTNPVPSAFVTLKAGVNWSTDAQHVSTAKNLLGDPVTRSLAPSDNAALGRFVFALWLLIQQKVATKRIAVASRAERRRSERDGRPEQASDVVVIELRRPIGREAEHHGSAPVEWSHRWMVDGHWRNQFFPGSGQHSPIWIAPYVKGPEDKPFQPKERVYSWVR